MVHHTRSVTKHDSELRIASHAYPGIYQVAHSKTCYVHLPSMPSEKRFRHWDAALRYFEDHGGIPRRSGVERARRHGALPASPRGGPAKAPKVKRALVLDPPPEPDAPDAPPEPPEPDAPPEPEALAQEMEFGFELDDFPDVFSTESALALYSDDQLAAEVARRNALRESTVVAPQAVRVDLYCDETLDDPSTDAITEQPRITPTVTYAFGRCKPLHFQFQVDEVWQETHTSVWIEKSHPRWSDSKITDYMPKRKTPRAAACKAPKSNARRLVVANAVTAIPPSAVRLLEP